MGVTGVAGENPVDPDRREMSRSYDEADHGGIPFHMLSDQAGNIGRAYGVYDETQGIELRGRFIIDPDGVIQAMEVLTPPVGRRIAESIRQVQAFQVVRASGGAEATPAGWMPGDPVLRPGPDLVGNVWKEWKPNE